MRTDGSFTIEVVRGDVVESAHVVHAVVADAAGSVEAWGDRARPTIPRSAIKAIQALPLVATGALAAFEVSEEELALACASHSGETEHVEAVLEWLRRIGLSEADLECGPDLPLGKIARREFFAAGAEPSPVFNCCSGKHAGFLTTAIHLGESTAGYVLPCSPAQHRVTEATATFTGLDLAGERPGIDGCGIPVFALPLERLAFAMARLVHPVDLPSAVAETTVPVVRAAQRMFWVSGTGRTEHAVGAVATEPVVVKAGAEGVFMAALPERGLGIALKAADGSARASHAAIKAILRRLEVIPAADDEPILNKAGTVVGVMRPMLAKPERSVMAPA